MNRYSIAALVAVAALCAVGSSAVPGKERVASVDINIGKSRLLDHHSVSMPWVGVISRLNSATIAIR